MKKESLDQISKLIIQTILQSNINEQDKMELAINLMTFFDNYDCDLKVLQKNQQKRRKK